MSAHDPVCTRTDVPVLGCATCRAIQAARSAERATAADTWQTNLPLVTTDARKNERMAVERRIRESGVARWLPSHAWDLLIASIRGGSR